MNIFFLNNSIFSQKHKWQHCAINTKEADGVELQQPSITHAVKNIIKKSQSRPSLFWH